jgi:uncharacterized protein YjdB
LDKRRLELCPRGVKASLRAGAIALALAAAGCSSSSEPVAVDGVRVTPQSIQLTAIGATRQLVATISPANATDRVLTWESTDSTVASVDATGLVTARAGGVGIFITAITHDGHFQSSANVSVIP